MGQNPTFPVAAADLLENDIAKILIKGNRHAIPNDNRKIVLHT